MENNVLQSNRANLKRFSAKQLLRLLEPSAWNDKIVMPSEAFSTLVKEQLSR